MATEKEIEYNRTFLSLFICSKLYNDDQNTKGAKRVVPKEKENDDAYKMHVHSCPIWPSQAPMQRVVYNAYRLQGGKLNYLQIIPKRGQQFLQYATPWEIRYSVLVGAGWFAPVLDEHYTVVGHHGSVGAGDPINLIAPVGTPPRLDHNYPARHLLDDNVPVFVHYRTEELPPGWIRLRSDSTESRVHVLTTVDGQVLDSSSELIGNVVSVDYSPADLLAIAYFVVKLAASAGTKVTKTLWRKATANREKRVLEGPTTKLAKQAPPKQLEAGRAYINKNPQATSTEQQIGRALNRDAHDGRLPGIKRIEGGERPQVNVKGRKGDYDFVTTDGRVLKGDLFEPVTNDAKNVVTNIYRKSGQAEIVVVQFGQGSAKLGGRGTADMGIAEAQRIASDVLSTPGHSIHRVIVRKQNQILVDSRI